MKKIFTLLFSVTIVASAFAQRDDRDWASRNQQPGYSNGAYNHDGDHRNGDRDREERFERMRNDAVAQHGIQIANINRDIDYRIEQVKCDQYLNRRQKRRAIESLEDSRRHQIEASDFQFKHMIYDRR